jgi:hypothetical protein
MPANQPTEVLMPMEKQDASSPFSLWRACSARGEHAPGKTIFLLTPSRAFLAESWSMGPHHLI